MNASRSALTQLALMACFITVTSRGPEGRMIIAFDAVTTIESTNASCGYGVSVNLKNGQKICVIDSIDKIARSLAAQKTCE